MGKKNKDYWYMQRRTIKLQRHRIKRERKRKETRKKKAQDKRQGKQIKIIREGNHQKERKIPPPSNFSFINNTEELIVYFNKNSGLLDRGYIANFDLSGVEQLTFDAVALLMSKIKDPFYTHGGRLKGAGPSKPELGKIFSESNFLKYVNSTIIPGKICGDMLHHVSQESVNNDISGQMAEIVTKYFYPEGNKKYQHLHPVLIESMANTKDHAGYKQNKVFDWWLIYYIDEPNKVIRITFIDHGVGILGSLNSWGDHWFQKFGLSSNCDKIRSILEGKVLIPSRTRRKERGNGLLLMYEFSKRPEVNNFIIISNNVYANVSEDDYKEMKIKFRGTFLYWEMNY